MHESVWDASVSAGFKLRLPCAIFSSKIRLISATVSGRASQWITDRRPGYFSFKEAGTIGYTHWRTRRFSEKFLFDNRLTVSESFYVGWVLSRGNGDLGETAVAVRASIPQSEIRSSYLEIMKAAPALPVKQPGDETRSPVEGKGRCRENKRMLFAAC
jgi:hypothetical protein